ncbi:MAG: S10 family peptidase [Candidatus Omnitrophota bacterium]
MNSKVILMFISVIFSLFLSYIHAEAEELPGVSVTNHTITLNKKPLNYTATAGHMIMKDEAGKPQASIFFIAYTKEPKSDLSARPITFVFNGGPGSSSVWLHMGALGPKRVKMEDEGFQLPQPYQCIDNESTWLEFTDLVFIDPVGTGYSRAAAGVEPKTFHGLNEDIQSVGDFIRLYVTRNNRWLSPKYLCGESYGTTRAAGLSGYLQTTHGMNLQGIVLLSSVLNFQYDHFAPGNDYPPILYLPTYTAAAWYHKKLPEKYLGDLKATLNEVKQWAVTDYMLALAKGDRLPPEEREMIIDKLSQYTGLSKKYIDKHNLRINIYSFVQELLGDEKQRVGRLDSRFKAYAGGEANEIMTDDPSYSAIFAPNTSVIYHYLRNDLKYANDIPYFILSHIPSWNWGTDNQYANVAETLRDAIEKNVHLKVMICNGYYDLATPFFATEYTVNHMGLPPFLAKNISMKYFEAGHMMYIRKPCLQQLRQDAEAFYTQAAAK